MSDETKIANRVYWMVEKKAASVSMAILDAIQDEQRELAIVVNAKTLHEKQGLLKRTLGWREGRALKRKADRMRSKIANLARWMAFVSSIPDYEDVQLTFDDYSYFFVNQKHDINV